MDGFQPFLMTGFMAILGWQTVTLHNLSERMARLEADVYYIRQYQQKEHAKYELDTKPLG